ncbi:MAG TPA: peptide chain release factor 1 [Syntrophomonadaceae bacterium]|nr:peptide chain release factor 1 [Syntrophomonadaceae bacterium]
MLNRLEKLKERYDELTELLSQPEIISDQNKFQEYAKEHADLVDIVNKYLEHKSVQIQIKDSKEMLEEEEDEEFCQMLRDELEDLERQEEIITAELKVLLLPQDPNDNKSVIMEIRAGTGGGEAALFAADLFRMYTRFAEEQGWNIDLMNSHYTDIGGIKEIIFVIDGKGAYSKLKYESGVHRVQRIPSTESGGRIHTSAATVAVLPEAEELDLEIDQNELRVDVYCSSGPGGQSVNTTQSAVRITHEPTGLVVTCQDEKSQHKNKAKAMRVLRARLKEVFEEEKNAELAGERKGQIGSGDRSERIRTYNFPQGRVSDHRINLTLHKLEAIMEGQLMEMIDALAIYEQERQLKQVD